MQKTFQIEGASLTHNNSKQERLNLKKLIHMIYTCVAANIIQCIKHSLSNSGTWNSANTTSVQLHYNITAIHKLLLNCSRLLGVTFENSSLFPKKCKPVLETSPYQRHPRDNRSYVLLTIVRKSCTTNEAKLLDADADQII